MSSEVIKSAVCEGCNPRCRVLVHSENGKLVKMREDKAHPRSATTWPPTQACPRFRAAEEFMYHKDRLNFPLKRAGEKGEGKWKKISWVQAFDEIADKLERLKGKYGAETLACHSGTLRTTEWVHPRFMNLFGSPNHVNPGNVCHAPCINTAVAMLGWPPTHRTFLRFERDASGKVTTGCLLLIGINPARSRPHMWKAIRDGKKQGVKLIVVDPRKTETTDLADIWLQLRPGTDTALLMSMINVIIENDLYHEDFVEHWCHGFPELRERSMAYPPEKISEITQVPTEKIKEAARLYALNTPTLTIESMGLEQQSNAIAGIQAKFILSALTGSYDIPGGEYIPGPAKCITEPEMELREELSPEQKKNQIGTDRFRLIGWPGRDAMLPHVIKTWGKPFSAQRASAPAHHPTLYRAILTGDPYPVRAMMGIASNPMVTQPNVKLIYKALKSLDLYVVQDYWMTPSAALADYVLPVTSWLERPYLGAGLGSHDSILGGEKALPSTIPGEYDRKTDYEILRGLGLRLGQERYWPWEDLEQVFDYMLSPLNLTFNEFMIAGGYESPPRQFRKYEKMGFGTPTGKVELFSTILEQLGYDPLPTYEEPHENPVSKPELAREYPLMLCTGGRISEFFHSEQRQIDSIRRMHPDPLVQIHPETANTLDIQEGNWVWIESPRGRIRQKATLFAGMDPKMVHCEHGWWFPELPEEEPWLHGVWESNINVLTDDDPDVCDKMGGGWPLKWGLCRVYRVKEY
ncbi:molybdopterin oxidoreductase [delta proteobacterium NaphS2]|nr:molybdopterin oxidoreductase [delta proteobacterium NaphS2]